MAECSIAVRLIGLHQLEDQRAGDIVGLQRGVGDDQFT